MVIYNTSGIRGVATTVKAWAKATRTILANEAHTRETTHKVGYAKTLANWRNEVESKKLASPRDFKEAVRIQGRREIPPWFMDKDLFEGLLQEPGEYALTGLVALSNLSRTQPPPGKEEAVEALHGFAATVSAPRKNNLRVRKFVANCWKRFRGKEVRNTSHWSIAHKASGEYSRTRGGKTQEVIDKVVHEFMHRKVSDLLPDMPDEDLIDMTGTIALRAGTWTPDVLVGDIMYPDLVTDVENHADARLGHIGLLWAIQDLRTNEIMDLEMTGEIASSGLFPASLGVGKIFLYFAELLTRVEALQEEGWKVRVITITSMAATVIGHVARHMLDPILWHDKLLACGLKDKVKLWSLLQHHIRYPGKYADSVDLTTATDVPPDEIIEDVLFGMLDGIRHPQDNFLRFACQLAASKRRFVFSPIKGAEKPLPEPPEHNRGIMMGEPLSGIFLNAMSYTIRALYVPLAEKYPQIDGNAQYLSNDQIDEFISDHEAELQELLDSCMPVNSLTSSQSGDDVVVFDDVSKSNILRLAYRMFELKPSENTWFSSDRYALFTEEVALRVKGGRWAFMDVPKPRVFADSGGDPDGDPVLGKLQLLSNYLRYVVEESGTEHFLYSRCCEIANLMVQRNSKLATVIRRHDLPAGLPGQLGGISHPAGLAPGYLRTLKPKYIKILNGIRQLSPMELTEFMHEPGDTRGVPEDLIAQYVTDFLAYVKDDLGGEMVRQEEILLEMEPWERRHRYKLKQRVSRKGLLSISASLDNLTRKITFLLSLEGRAERNRSSPIRQLPTTVERLAARFHSASDDPVDLPDDLVVYMKSLVDRMNEIYIPRSALDSFLAGLNLPVMTVKFVRS